MNKINRHLLFVFFFILIASLHVEGQSVFLSNNEFSDSNVRITPGETYTNGHRKLSIRNGGDHYNFRNDALVYSSPTQNEIAFGFASYPAEELDDSNDLSYDTSPGYLVIDNTLITFCFHWKNNRKNINSRYELALNAHSVASSYQVNAAPYKDETYYVSRFYPLVINEYTLSLSEGASSETNPIKRDQLKILNTKSGETELIPLYLINQPKTVGRLHVGINSPYCYPMTQTVRLSIAIDADLSVRGADAYVENYEIPTNANYESFFSQLGKQYGFEVVWEAYPGYPESIDYIKSCPFMNLKLINPVDREISIVRNQVQYIADVLKDSPRKEWAITVNWDDSTHLRIRPKNYDLVISEIEYNKKRIELGDQFVQEHTPVRRIYKIEGLQAQTILGLIEQDIHRYSINQSGEHQIKMEDRKIEDIQFNLRAIREPEVIDPNEKFAIESYKGVIIEEKAVVDEKNNLLIVNALPETQAKIEKLLAEMGAYLGDVQKKSVPTGLPLEIILLAGSNDPIADATQVVNPQRYGFDIKDIETFNLCALIELGKASVNLMAERGDVGQLQATLGKNYRCQMEYMDTRLPYILVKTGLYESESDKLVLENTLFLEAGKPSLLGVTNLKQALILIVRISGKQ